MTKATVEPKLNAAASRIQQNQTNGFQIPRRCRSPTSYETSSPCLPASVDYYSRKSFSKLDILFMGRLPNTPLILRLVTSLSSVCQTTVSVKASASGGWGCCFSCNQRSPEAGRVLQMNNVRTCSMCKCGNQHTHTHTLTRTHARMHARTHAPTHTHKQKTTTQNNNKKHGQPTNQPTNTTTTTTTT